jgi:proteasome lid subunit RPN8/RPN11
MARGVRAATNLGLQVVAQVHTHPSIAYHSDGDVEGARIRYPGYGSIVLPDYGRSLPRLDDAAVYFFDMANTWVQLEPKEVIVIPERVP